jgi:hypothetical protein
MDDERGGDLQRAPPHGPAAHRYRNGAARVAADGVWALGFEYWNDGANRLFIPTHLL